MLFTGFVGIVVLYFPGLSLAGIVGIVTSTVAYTSTYISIHIYMQFMKGA